MLDEILVRKDYSLQETFNLDPAVVPADITVQGYDIPDPETFPEGSDQRAYAMFLRAAVPEPDPNYVFRLDVLRDLQTWWSNELTRDVLFLYGPTGSGKTSSHDEWCSRLCVPRFALKGHKAFEAHEAFGHYVLGPNGETVFAPGPVTLAAQYGLPCIINEFDRIQQARAIVFNDVFEGRAFPMPGKHGEMLVPQPGFKVCITGNTNMVEDLTGNYGTASAHDTSVLERLFAVRVGYPERDVEEGILLKDYEFMTDELLAYWFEQEQFKVKTAAGIKVGAAISRQEFVATGVDWAHMVRKQSKDGGSVEDQALERTISTRALRKIYTLAAQKCRMAELHGKSSMHYALSRHVSNLATESTSIALHQSLEAAFGVGPALN